MTCWCVTYLFPPILSSIRLEWHIDVSPSARLKWGPPEMICSLHHHPVEIFVFALYILSKLSLACWLIVALLYQPLVYACHVFYPLYCIPYHCSRLYTHEKCKRWLFTNQRNNECEVVKSRLCYVTCKCFRSVLSNFFSIFFYGSRLVSSVHCLVYWSMTFETDVLHNAYTQTHIGEHTATHTVYGHGQLANARLVVQLTNGGYAKADVPLQFALIVQSCRYLFITIFIT